MAEIAVNYLLEKLGAFLVDEARLLGGVRQEIEGLKEELESIQTFLKDADKKRDSNEEIRTWVNQVRRIAYDIEDVIDEFVLRFGGGHAGGGIMNFLRTLATAMKQPLLSRDLATKIRDIKKTIVDISQRKSRYDIQRREGDNSLDETIRRWQDEEANFLEEAEVVGIEEDMKHLVNRLVGVTGEDPETYELISVVGMGGLGKTTLVRKVYKQQKLKEHFHCSAWVSVSQSFNGKELLKSMLIDFCQMKGQNSLVARKEKTHLSKMEIEQMNEDDLKTEVKNYLQGKRFILVLDDVWDRRVWDYAKLALPLKSNGSKIMITTRIENLAFQSDEFRKISVFSHPLEPLDDDVASELLCRKTFPGHTTMPPNFEEVGKSMLRRCGGLPLAIVALGGVLRRKTILEWEKVNRNLMETLGNSTRRGSSITSILKLSYHELPLRLRPCFLYCGLFPEDHLIKRNKLIRLWVAEGFIEERSGSVTKEEVGEEYLNQLVGRSMLQIAETSIDGRVKSCRIHDLMRDLAMSISHEEEFSCTLDTQVMKLEEVIKPRRMCVTGKDKENAVLSSTANIQLLRSLLLFNVDLRTRNLISYSRKFTLLRVLDLEGGLPGKRLGTQSSAIGQLLHLRYLNLRDNRNLKQLPRSMGRLKNLETLDVRFTRIWKLPNGIVRLKNLRHLCVGGTGSISVPKGIANLRCLQTLIGMDCSSKGIAGEIGKLKELRRLDIDKVEEENAEELYAAISRLTHLSTLIIRPKHRDHPFGKTLLERPPPHLRILRLCGLSELPPSLGSFNNLIKLKIWFAPIREDPFPALSSFPSLLHLELSWLNNVERLHCGPQGFPKLQRLQLRAMLKLESVEFEEGSMPSLKWLHIEYCDKLEMVPQGIQHLKLEELKLKAMSEEFIRKLKEGGEDHSKILHIPLVTRDSGDELAMFQF